MPDPVLTARGRLAYASRRGTDPEVTAAARRDLAAAKLERHVREVIDSCPPLGSPWTASTSSFRWATFPVPAEHADLRGVQTLEGSLRIGRLQRQRVG